MTVTLDPKVELVQIMFLASDPFNKQKRAKGVAEFKWLNCSGEDFYSICEIRWSTATGDPISSRIHSIDQDRPIFGRLESAKEWLSQVLMAKEHGGEACFVPSLCQNNGCLADCPVIQVFADDYFQ